MNQRPDDNDQLASLLRALPAPEPPPRFAVSARRRYLEAMAARARREAITGVAAALIGLAVMAALALTVVDPTTLVVWLAETVADMARWAAGIGVVLALVPPAFSASFVLASAATVLSLLLVARARAIAAAK